MKLKMHYLKGSWAPVAVRRSTAVARVITRADIYIHGSRIISITGTKKSYISRIEYGRADIQLSTLFKLIEQGLNRKLEQGLNRKLELYIR